MVRFGRFIAKNRILVIIISLVLFVPAVFGYLKTRVNYDLLSYLPDTLETVEGQNIMVDEFGTGAFSMCIVENMKLKDVQKLKEKFEEVEHVKKVLWYDNIADISVPSSMLPKEIRDVFFDGDNTLMIILFDDTTSADTTMEACTKLRSIANKQCYIAGMTGVVTDIKDVALEELPIYVAIAAVLSFVVLELVLDSFLVPVFFLLSIGLAIVYNLGSNIVFGETSYITQALTAVLQLGVTMDYSIFLLHSYEEAKEEHPEDSITAMAHAIAATFKSIVGSSVTTVAGFLALCVMTFALGTDLGIVMSKGVIIGVICCVTVLPAFILTFDKWIEKTKHRPLIKTVEHLSGFVTKHYIAWIVIMIILLVPAIYGNNHYSIYYNIDKSLPADLPCNVASAKMNETFNMSNIHMVMLKSGLDAKTKTKMLKEMEKVDGVKWCLGLDSYIGPLVPKAFIPKELKNVLESDKHEMLFVCSEYGSATDPVNAQLKDLNKIVKKYDDSAMIIGEAPLMKDLQDTTDVDLNRVNLLSMAAIFIIILFVFKSISLPFILILVIEFAINVNMAFACYMHVSLPFVASIVVGTIQLGATVDYAILMTSRYLKERLDGLSKKEAVQIAHRTSMLSIITSGFSFFAATFGVAAYSRVDMIGSICVLLARGAVISMVVVILVLPAMFMIFDPLIIHTTAGFGKKNKKFFSKELHA